MNLTGKKIVCKNGLGIFFLSLISFLPVWLPIIFFLLIPICRSGNAYAGETVRLGVQVQPLEGTALWRFLGRSTGRGEGVIVSAVAPESPAEQMGIKKNDVILAVNNMDLKKPNEVNQFTDIVSALNPGDKVVFLVYRLSPTLLTIEGTMGQPKGVAGTKETPEPAEETRPVNTNVSAMVFAPTGQHEITSVAFSPDGKKVIAGGNSNHSLTLWDIATGREIKTFAGDTAPVYSIAFSPDGKYVLSGSTHYTMTLWDVATAKAIRVFTGSTESDLIDSVAFSPDGHNVLSGASDKTLMLWDVATGKEIRTFTGHAGWVSSVAFSPDGRYLLSGSWDGTLRLWDIATGQARIFATSAVGGAERSRRGGRGRSGSTSSPDTYTPTTVVPAVIQMTADKLGMHMSSFAHRISSVAFSPDGRYAVSGNWGGTLFLWDIETGKPVRTFTGHTDRVNTVAFSPDGSRIISASRDNTIKLWDIETGGEIRTFTGHRGDISSLAFSADPACFISGGSDGTIRQWNIKTGNEIAQFISLKDGEWIVITPEGYYNSSLNGHKYVNVRVGTTVYGIDQFYDVFYRPDIVMAKLKGDDISGLITLTIADALRDPPPTVEFTDVPSETDQSVVRVCYKIKSTGGGIGEVRLFHNGKLIASDGFYRDVAKLSAEKTRLAALNGNAIYKEMRGVIIKRKADATPIVSKPKGSLFETCKEVESIAGENEVSLAAFNSSNTIQSYMKTAAFNADIKAEEPHLYIFAVGIDQYTDSSVNLKYAAKDAQDITRKLVQQSATLFRPRNIHQDLLIDKAATKTNILNTINKIARMAKPADSFIFFDAGHGILLQDQYYMLTSEYDGNVNPGIMLSSNEIVEMSKKIESLSQLFIFDTCHAGGVDYIVGGLYDARMSVLAKKMGLHIYASASDKQTAIDGYQGNGLFSYILLDGLNNNQKADVNNDGRVGLVELGSFAKQMTTALSATIGHMQTPLIINFGKDSALYQLK